MDPDLKFALELADLADEVSMSWFRRPNLRYETKHDGSPVSDADRAVEDAVRDAIARRRPGDAVMGEEEGSAEGERRWIVDPIDGTSNYVRGARLWGTLVALERGGALTLGVVSAPALAARWWGSHGGGAFVDGEPIVPSRVASLDKATLLYATPDSVERTGWGKRFAVLARRCRAAHPGFGGFWPHVLVAQGDAEIAVQAGTNLWDIAAPAVVVNEAGGRISGIGGRPGLAGELLVSSNAQLHPQALACLAE